MTAHIFKVDKYVVPTTIQAEFIEKVRLTHEVLQAQPGFVQGMVLEQCSGPGTFNLVTVVEWENADALEAARAAVQALHARLGFNPQAFSEQHGIRADVGNYRRVGT